MVNSGHTDMRFWTKTIRSSIYLHPVEIPTGEKAWRTLKEEGEIRTQQQVTVALPCKQHYYMEASKPRWWWGSYSLSKVYRTVPEQQWRGVYRFNGELEDIQIIFVQSNLTLKQVKEYMAAFEKNMQDDTKWARTVDKYHYSNY